MLGRGVGVGVGVGMGMGMGGGGACLQSITCDFWLVDKGFSAIVRTKSRGLFLGIW